MKQAAFTDLRGRNQFGFFLTSAVGDSARWGLNNSSDVHGAHQHSHVLALITPTMEN